MSSAVLDVPIVGEAEKQGGYLTTVSHSWSNVADGVFIRRSGPLELVVGLVVGTERCLLVETGSCLEEGLDLRERVREITDLPIEVVNTHGHFDHCFGNAAFIDVPRWGHRKLSIWLETCGVRHRHFIAQALGAIGMDELAERVRRVTIVSPDHFVDERVVLDLGGRRVHILFGGRGHSAYDLVVAVPDVRLTFWGDLVDVAADPEFDDGYPLEWADTLSRLLDTVEVGLSRIAIPGHGDIGTLEHVEVLHHRLDRLARKLRAGVEAGETSREALTARIARTGFAPATLDQAVARVLG